MRKKKWVKWLELYPPMQCLLPLWWDSPIYLRQHGLSSARVPHPLDCVAKEVARLHRQSAGTHPAAYIYSCKHTHVHIYNILTLFTSLLTNDWHASCRVLKSQDLSLLFFTNLMNTCKEIHRNFLTIDDINNLTVKKKNVLNSKREWNYHFRMLFIIDCGVRLWNQKIKCTWKGILSSWTPHIIWCY